MTVVATGQMVHQALAVAGEIENAVSLEIIDPRSLEPLDIETIVASVRKTGRLVVMDEDTTRCGVGAEIVMQVIEHCFDSLDAPPQRLGAANMPIPGGYTERHVLPQPADLRAAIEAVIGQPLPA